MKTSKFFICALMFVSTSELLAQSDSLSPPVPTPEYNDARITVNRNSIDQNTIDISNLKDTTTANARNITINRNANNDTRVFATENRAQINSLQGLTTENRGLINNNTRRLDGLEEGVKIANQGVAMALASAPSYGVDDKRGRVNAGIGTFEGETAVSVSGTYRLKNEYGHNSNRFVYATVGKSGDSEGGSVGLSFGW